MHALIQSVGCLFQMQKHMESSNELTDLSAALYSSLLALLTERCAAILKSAAFGFRQLVRIHK